MARAITGAETQQETTPTTPYTVPSVFNGASGFKIDNANMVGRDSFAGGQTNFHITVDNLPELLKVQYEGLEKAFQLREQRIQAREVELEKKIADWKAVQVEAHRSSAEREQVEAEKRSAQMSELKMKEESLEIGLKEVDQRRSELDALEASLREREHELENRLGEVRDAEMRYQKENESLSLRLRRTESDLSSLRREELQRQLGCSSGDLLKYTTGALQQAFGKNHALGIDHILSRFDFSKIDMACIDKMDGLHIPLAPFYDDIDKRQMEAMPVTLKVAIAGVISALHETRLNPESGLSNWAGIENILRTTPEIRAVGMKTVCTQEMEVGGVIEPSNLRMIGRWFRDLLDGDGKFRCVTPGALATIPNFKGERRQTQRPSAIKTLLDVTVIWLPGLIRRSFKLSRTTVTLWIKTTQGRQPLGRVKRTTVLSAEHVVGCTYHPRDSLIEGMSHKNREIATALAERIFDFQ